MREWGGNLGGLIWTGRGLLAQMLNRGRQFAKGKQHPLPNDDSTRTSVESPRFSQWLNLIFPLDLFSLSLSFNPC